jgi:hypothetical protein
MSRHPNIPNLPSIQAHTPVRMPNSPSMQSMSCITHDDCSRHYKKCRCAGCGYEDICTPRTNFKPKVTGGELYCKRCHV